ncbi:MAG: hypothetical protein ACREXX_16525 [Gammaproteobacteria bacterium]
MSRRANATVEDLYGAPDKGKAEIVNGELILMAPHGRCTGASGRRDLCQPARVRAAEDRLWLCVPG